MSQFVTGLLISGSVALEFFSGSSFNGDLDLYCPLSSSVSIGLWLARIGYKFLANTTEPSQAPLFITDWGLAIEDRSTSTSTTSSSCYSFSSGIMRVWNFSRNGETIQLIAVRSTPLSVILRFHSCQSCFIYLLCVLHLTFVFSTRYECHIRFICFLLVPQVYNRIACLVFLYGSFIDHHREYRFKILCSWLFLSLSASLVYYITRLRVDSYPCTISA